jgi:hypothetical protein
MHYKTANGDPGTMQRAGVSEFPGAREGTTTCERFVIAAKAAVAPVYAIGG